MSQFQHVPRESTILAEINAGHMREFYRWLDSLYGKLGGTSVTLDELDQRSGWPGPAIVEEVEREIKAIVASQVAPLKAYISELERRIDSIEKSARV